MSRVHDVLTAMKENTWPSATELSMSLPLNPSDIRDVLAVLERGGMVEHEDVEKEPRYLKGFRNDR